MTTSRPFISFDFDNCLAPGNAVGENLLAPLFDDPGEPPRKGKGHYFALACDKYGVDPQDVWVIGDSAESEIAAGNALGMKTVQILRAGVERHASADYHVTGLHEFAKLAGA